MFVSSILTTLFPFKPVHNHATVSFPDRSYSLADSEIYVEVTMGLGWGIYIYLDKLQRLRFTACSPPFF